MILLQNSNKTALIFKKDKVSFDQLIGITAV